MFYYKLSNCSRKSPLNLQGGENLVDTLAEPFIAFEGAVFAVKINVSLPENYQKTVVLSATNVGNADAVDICSVSLLSVSTYICCLYLKQYLQ